MPPKKRSSSDADDGKKNAESTPAKMNKTSCDFEKLSFDCDSKSKEGKEWNLKICTWNVAGIRSWIKKGGLDFLKYEKPDVLCLQEIKCSVAKLPAEIKVNIHVSYVFVFLPLFILFNQDLEDYPHQYYMPAEKEGYAGVALLSKTKPIKVTLGMQVPESKEHDAEGRLLTAEFDHFYVVTTYVPNAGRKLVTLPKRMEWDPLMREHVKTLDSKKPVILCGDLNVAHKEIDLANPKTNQKSAGFTKEERAGNDVNEYLHMHT
jgi:AP endonuclease-1